MKRFFLGFIISTLIFLLIAADFGGVRLRFGSATLNDSGSIITTNKSFLVNGNFRSLDSIDAGGLLRADELELDGAGAGVLFKTYGSLIESGINALNYFAGTHNFRTETGTDLITIDSTNGIKQIVAGYQSRGLMQTLVYQIHCSTVTNVFRRIPHGLGPNITHRLLDVDIKFYDDSTKTWYPSGYNATTTLVTGTVWSVDTTNLVYFVPAAGGNWKNQSDTIRWILRVLTQ